jgi:hypothetical protein
VTTVAILSRLALIAAAPGATLALAVYVLARLVWAIQRTVLRLAVAALAVLFFCPLAAALAWALLRQPGMQAWLSLF